MGPCASLCAGPTKGQYESLVLSKPGPVSLEDVRLVSSDSTDVPLFGPAASDDKVEGQPETVTDDELSIYAGKLSRSKQD